MITLLVEDDATKREDISRILQNQDILFEIDVASNKLSAERMLDSKRYDLLLLDMSMSIAGEESSFDWSGYANLAGLDLLERQNILDRFVPVIVITAYEYFRTSETDLAVRGFMGISDLEEEIRLHAGASFIGVVRYGSRSWESDLVKFLNGISSK